MSNAPRVKVDITKNIHSIIAIHPNIAWDDVVEGIKESVQRGFMYVVRDITVTPENGLVHALEDVVGQVDTVSISDDSVEVSIYSRSGPYSGYLSVMIEKNMVKPEMFRLAKYGLKTALVLQ